MVWLTGAVLFGLLALMLVLDFPITLALGMSSLITIVCFGIVPLDFLPQLMFGAADSFTLLAIPFFIFTGIILGHTTISRRLIDLADSLVGDIPGGLGIVGIIAAVFFAGISGSGPADVAALGLVLIPAMSRAGYGRGFSAALTAASGGIGIIVPPSIALIVYGFIAEVSISKLFIAGIIPGIIVAGMLGTVTVLVSKRQGYATSSRGDRMPAGLAFRRAVWGLMAPVIILGGIYGGVFTPTEAAAVAVVYGVLVDILVYRTLSLRGLINAAAEAGVTSSVIMSIVLTASLFSWLLNTQGIAAEGASVLISLTSNRIVLLLAINVLLIGAGLFLDAISIFYIFLPVLLPVIRHIGMDPIHFGIMVTVNLAIGQITPPVGVNLVAASSISGIGIGEISRSALPFIAGELIALLLILLVPDLTLFLPSLFG